MNRRKFAQSVMGTIGVSMLANPTLACTKLNQTEFQTQFKTGHKMQTDDGFKMTISNHSLPTFNKDKKQFVLTFDVNNSNGSLDEKIYHLTDQNGKKHQMFMTPVDHNRLQAVFNWRTHA